MTSNIKGVLFDLDGTLIDSAPDLHNCINKVLVNNNKQKVPFSKLRELFSHGSENIIKGCFDGDIDDKIIKHLRDQFWDYYSRSLTDKTTVFPDIDTVLCNLDQKNIPWGIVTNKIKRFAKPIIKHFKWDSRATTLIYGDTLTSSKPSPEPLLMAAEKLKVKPENCIYIGDTSIDVTAAKGAKMTSIVVGYGYNDLNLKELNKMADHFIEKAIDLNMIIFEKSL